MVSSRSPKPLFGVQIPAVVLTFSRSSVGLERLSDTQKVVGSIPTVRTLYIGVGQMVIPVWFETRIFVGSNPTT